jgi:hypothetical protein
LTDPPVWKDRGRMKLFGTDGGTQTERRGLSHSGLRGCAAGTDELTARLAASKDRGPACDRTLFGPSSRSTNELVLAVPVPAYVSCVFETVCVDVVIAAPDSSLSRLLSCSHCVRPLIHHAYCVVNCGELRGSRMAQTACLQLCIPNRIPTTTKGSDPTSSLAS